VALAVPFSDALRVDPRVDRPRLTVARALKQWRMPTPHPLSPPRGAPVRAGQGLPHGRADAQPDGRVLGEALGRQGGRPLRADRAEDGRHAPIGARHRDMRRLGRSGLHHRLRGDCVYSDRDSTTAPSTRSGEPEGAPGSSGPAPSKLARGSRASPVLPIGAALSRAARGPWLLG
jgi:hypothetical protein